MKKKKYVFAFVFNLNKENILLCEKEMAIQTIYGTLAPNLIHTVILIQAF